MSFRVIRRTLALVSVLIASIARFWLMRLRGACTLEQRALWVQQTCAHVLRSMEIACKIEGPIPTAGLVVTNHLSYLDIIILSATMPCFFVAKAEIDRWPYFGKAARVGGTMFIDRSSLASAERVSAEISERLKLKIPVVFFPEGTSTDGNLQRFHSRLFEPAIRAQSQITAASIRYVVGEGRPERELCWFGETHFAPHLWNTLHLPSFHAELRFGQPHLYPHRRVAADATYAEIASLRRTPEHEAELTSV